MKNLPGYIALFALVVFLQSCCGCKDEKVIEKPIISFAVAGHIYGDPDDYTSSVYPPFLTILNQDHKTRKFDYLFLTGDLVADSTKQIWMNVEDELDALEIPWYIARGNHDNGIYLDQNIQKEKYLSIRKHRALFLVLNTSNAGWTVDSLQRDFLIGELSNTDTVEQIFVFSHQLWWERNPPEAFQLDSLRPNSSTYYEGASDFWQDAFPFFDSTGIETWFFAGDMGSHRTLPTYYEDHHKKFHFYGSGMGGGIRDNYLIVEVYQNGRVDIEKREF
ncbi:MAG: metallophosphoesterase [Crocinitomicaceae bacterium]|nr:metallophosphoesterase [Crocinitomicaceae bacterium]